MQKKVSMDEIAKRLGVSKNTISLALRGMPGISEQTRKLIFDTAEEMGYRHKSGEIKKEAVRNLCLIIPKSARESIGFFSFIQLGVEDEAKRNNFNTILHYYDETEMPFETPICIREGMVSGIISIGKISERTANTLLGFNLPLVIVDQYFDELKTDYILSDNYCGGYIAAKYLIQCGHREIGFIGNIGASVSFYDRYLGYLKAMETSGLNCDKNVSILDKSLEELSKKDILQAADAVRNVGKLPSAYFCCNDAEAIALYKALKQMNISIGEDVSVIGFDDIELSKEVIPELTTMHVSKEWMGKKAVQKLLSMLDKGGETAEKLLLSVELVERNSVKKIHVTYL